MDLAKARNGSLLAKYSAAVLLVFGTLAIGLGWLRLTVGDLFYAALGLLAIFGTVDINLFLEKLTGRGRGDGA